MTDSGSDGVRASVEVAVVGGGNMGAALVEGMIGSGRFASASIAIAERIPDRRRELTAMFPEVAVGGEIPSCPAVVVAVKPDAAPDAVREAVAAGADRILSIAAGVTIATLERAADDAVDADDDAVDADGDGRRRVAVVRAMPNTPALVGQGAAAIAGGTAAEEGDLQWAEAILGAVGIVERLDESLLDAFTGVAGSGPAYVFLFAEALCDAAVAEGIPFDVADRVVTQLLSGSAALLNRHGDPAGLRRNVTSPRGTTEAGIARFEEHDLRAVVADAVSAATRRSRELG